MSALLPCIRQQIKGEKNDEIRHSSLINSKPHEVKSTDMHCILTTNIKKCRGEKNDEKERMPDLRLGNVSSYQAGVSPEGGLEVGQTLWFFLEVLCEQANLFWREMKINKMYTETKRG